MLDIEVYYYCKDLLYMHVTLMQKLVYLCVSMVTELLFSSGQHYTQVSLGLHFDDDDDIC